MKSKRDAQWSVVHNPADGRWCLINDHLMVAITFETEAEALAEYDGMIAMSDHDQRAIIEICLLRMRRPRSSAPATHKGRK
jgi:hypothetical protein